MSAYGFLEEVKLIEDEEYSKKKIEEGHEGYGEIPLVKLIKEGEEYYPQVAYGWLAETVELKRGNRVYDFETHWNDEVKVIDKDGKSKWMDAHKVDDFFEGVNLQYLRPKESYYINIYDSKKKIVEKYKVLLDSIKPMTDWDFKIKFNQEVKKEELLTQDDVNNMERNEALKDSKNSNTKKKIESFLLLPDELKNDKDIICAFFGLNKDDLSKYNEDIWSDLEFVKKVVKIDIRLLESAKDNIRGNKDFINELMKDYDHSKSELCAFDYASNSLKDDKEFVLPYIRKNGYFLNQLSEHLKNDFEICIAALVTDFNLFYYAVGIKFDDAWNNCKLKKEDFIYDENNEVYDYYMEYVNSKNK